jgi:hypothetical protein
VFAFARWADFVITGVCLAIIAQLRCAGRHRTWIVGLGLLTLVLVASGVSKVLNPAAFSRLVQQMGFGSTAADPFSRLIGLGEFALALALLKPGWRTWGLLTSVCFLALFCGVVAILLTRQYSGDCGCLPWADKLGWWTLLRDGAMLGLCLVLYRRSTVERRAGHGPINNSSRCLTKTEADISSGDRVAHSTSAARFRTGAPEL